MEGEQPHLGDLLTMVINHLLTGMILQVDKWFSLSLQWCFGSCCCCCCFFLANISFEKTLVVHGTLIPMIYSVCLTRKPRRDEGFWVSYNSPFFKEIREVSGADDMEKRFGDAYSYTKNPRAKIFQRDISHATETWKSEVFSWKVEVWWKKWENWAVWKSRIFDVFWGLFGLFSQDLKSMVIHTSEYIHIKKWQSLQG